MTKIKFRAKAINRNPKHKYRTNYKNGDWVYGLITDLPIETSFGTSPAQMTNEEGISRIDVDIETLGQYVGFKDKNTNEIYDGDIICFIDKNYPLIVTWHEYKWVLVEPKDTNIKIDFIIRLANECEVIGNIYDNLELIGE